MIEVADKQTEIPGHGGSLSASRWTPVWFVCGVQGGGPTTRVFANRHVMVAQNTKLFY